MVFTLPQLLAPLALQNKRVIYGILFQAASESLLEIAADPKHLGAAIGFLAVLHTWGPNLHPHPHLHCMVPGGGLSVDGSRWISCRKKFFLPVKVLSRLFRNRFVAYLRKAFQQGKLSFHGQLKSFAEAKDFAGLLNRIGKTEWVVYAKPPLGGPKQALRYLARYTHRVAISNQRLLACQHGQVTFRWKDYSQANLPRAMTLDALEFIRRFLFHVLPAGFMRIRHYGLLSNRSRKEKIALCRKLLTGSQNLEDPCPPDSSQSMADDSPPLNSDSCPACKKGRMVVVEMLQPQWIGTPYPFTGVLLCDTS